MELTSGQLKKSGFEAALKSTFVVSAVEQATPGHGMTLTELRSRPAPPGFEQFSLLFEGPPEPMLPQGIYQFRHDQLGEMPLFTVPIGKNSHAAQYEVCISRTTDSD